MKNIGKRILCLLCAAVMVLSMIVLPESPVQAAETTDGLDLSAMQIVLPASATTVESTAAAELQTYIYKITGVQPSIKSEGSNSGAGIYIGATNYAKLKGVTYPTDGDTNGEAWAIRAVGGNLFLCGAPARGPLYAVYHLLEDVLGVRWWNLWEEDVPTGDAIVPADYADSGVPVMEYRDIFVGLETTTDYAFYARNRLNGFTTNIPESYGGEESYGYAHVHTFNRYFTSTDFASHPEWFSYVDGARVSDGQLCLTNTELQTEFAARLLSEVAKDPDAIYSVSPGDNTKFCQCESCQSEIAAYGMAGYVLNFVNKMAQAVTNAGYTDANVEMLVYWAHMDAPTGGIVPAANVQLRYADNYTDLLHGLDHANNAESMERLQSWIDIAQNDVYYWQYVVNYTNNGILPSMFHYGDDITTLAEMGVNGWFAEQEQCINTDFWDMKLWLISKLMEEPVSGEDYEALMDEFIYGYYGEEAGQYIHDYLYYMNEKAEASDLNQNFSADIIGAEWLTVSDIIAGHNYFEQAFAAAGDDATLLRRLRAARSGLDRVIVENFSSWQTKAAAAGLTLPFTKREVGERIYQTVTEQIELRGKYYDDQPGLADRYDQYADTTTALPDALSGYAREHMFEYTASDFRAANIDYVSIVEDSDSLLGTAFCSDISSFSIWDGTQRNMMKAINISAYDPNGTATNGIYSVGSVSASSLTLNDGYHLYSFDWTVPTMADGGYIYLFDDWGLQLESMKSDLDSLAGQTVRVYLSVKAVGSLSSSYFSGQYYIDRIIVLLTPDQPSHNYVTTASAYGDTCRSVCSVCGDVVLTPHDWNDGVVTVEPTASAEGEKVYTCSVCGGTKTEVLDKLAAPNAIDSIPSEHLVSMRDYSTFATDANSGTTYVDDADAYGGKAVCYAKTPLNSSNFISIKRYDNDKELTIGTLSLESLKVNAGYQVYQFTYDVPANATEGGVFFIMNNWQLNSKDFCADFAPYAGKTVEVYVSLKVTGPAEDGNYSVYVDRVALESVCADFVSDDRTVCTLCGKEMNPIDAIPDGHLASMRDYSYFATAESSGTTYVDDADAYGGKAVCYAKTPLNSSSFITIKRYDNSKELTIGNLPLESLKVNAGYQVYQFTYDVPADATDGGVFFIMNNWQLNSSQFSKDFAPYAGKTVEVYVSLKVTGPDADGNYSVFVDRVALESHCEYVSGDNGVSCSLCGKVDKLLSMIPGKHVLSARDYSCFPEKADQNTSYVVDGNAYNNMAVCHVDDNIGISITRYDSGVEQKIGTLSSAQLKINEGYQIHKFTFAVPADSTQGSFLYIMSNWQFQSEQLCNDLAAYAGQTVDMYLSMKVTGPTSDGKYALYIDRVVVASACQYEAGETGTACTVCGKVDALLSAIPGKHCEVVADHTCFPENAGQNTSYVVDGDAYNNLAVCHIDDNIGISITRYDSGVEQKIGSLSPEQLKVNEGYQIHKFTFAVPADSTQGSFVYIMSNWQFQSEQLCNDLAAYAGQTVEVYLSMKVTGPTSDGKYALYIDRVAIASVCQWDDGVITTKPTSEAEGVKTYTCSVCGGTKTESVAMLPAPVSSWSLTLGDRIAMNLVLNLTADEISSATVDVTVNGETRTEKAAALLNENGEAVLVVELAAAQMTDAVTVTLHTGDQDLTKSYTVRGYADYILDEANGYSDAAKALVKNMLNYGAAAQTYFSYNTDTLANGGIELTAAAVPTQGGQFAVSGSAEGIRFYGATLVHESKTAVRFYFSGSTEGIESAYQINEKNGLYYIEVGHIAPQDMDQDITVELSDGTNTLSVTYAPVDYIVRMYNKTGSSENTKALVQALYGYYLAAEAYIAQ